MKDVVYVVGSGSRAWLRWSLRSLANLPHGRVWIAGVKPQWVTDQVGHIPWRQSGTASQNTTGALRAACQHPEVSDQFWLFNDDFYVTEPVETVPVLHRGPVADWVAGRSNGYLDGAVRTAELLARLGFDNPLSYELHIPMMIDKRAMLEVLEVADYAKVDYRLHKRTLYGNYWRLGGAYADDVKVRDRRDPIPTHLPFLSTHATTWRTGAVRDYLRGRWPVRSPYETPAKRR